MWRTCRLRAAHLAVTVVTTLALAAMVAAPAVATVPPDEGAPTPDDTSAPGGPTTTTLPPGCTRPKPATAVFVGEVTAKDVKTARFEIIQVRSGSLQGFEVAGLVDVDYYDDVRYIDVGEEYIVGARGNSISNRLTSRVREPAPLFGGNDVVGVNDNEEECPVFEDPMRTLTLDGAAVESGVFAPMAGDKEGILRALLVPTMWIFIGLVIVVAVKNLFWTAGGEMWRLIRRQPTDIPQAARRSHAARERSAASDGRS